MVKGLADASVWDGKADQVVPDLLYTGDKGPPDQPVPDMPPPDQPVPDQPIPDQPLPDRAVPDQAAPDAARPDGGAEEQEEDEGCSCDLGAGHRPGAGWLLALIGVVFLTRRREVCEGSVMAVELHARPYGPDCTDQERQAILDRVEDLGGGLIKLRQLPVSTDYSFDLLLSRIVEFGQRHERVTLIGDLREAALPAASQRRIMRRKLTTLSSLQRVIIVNAHNPLFALMARFILAGMIGVEILLVDDLERALEIARGR